MKNRQFSKIALLAFSLALVICAIFAMTANAATTPEIANMNVEYTDKFCLVYAVPADTVQGGSATLYIYDEDPATGAEYIKDYTLTKTTPAGKKEAGGVGLDYEAYVFYTDGVAAMSLDQVFYAQVVDANNNKSAIKSYSVVEYLYTRLADVDGKQNTEKQNTLYESVIAFGTAAQNQFLKEDVLASTTLISDYYYFTAVGCTVNGKTSGVLPLNKTFDIEYDKASSSAYTLTTYTSYDKSEGETETTVSGKNLNVVSGKRVHIEAETSVVRTYRDGVMTFESETVGAAPSVLYTGSTSGAFDGGCYLSSDASNTRRKDSKVAQDTVFGEASNVLKVTPTSKGRLAAGALSGLTGDDIENATAIEFSFDFRVDTSKMASWENYFFETVFSNNNGLYEGGMTNIRFTLLANGTIQVDYRSHGASNGTIIPVTIFASDYNSFRMVARFDAETGKQYIDIYVNNFSDIPDATFEDTTGKITSVTDIDRGLFCMWDCDPTKADYTGVSFYLDNIWCGYTAD